MKASKQSRGMVDVGGKDVTQRRAVASATIVLGKKAFDSFLRQGSPKGNVLEVARVAAVMAAKGTPSIVPLCHPLPLEKVGVEFDIHKSRASITAIVEVACSGKTGVEMEALTAAAVACLTIYDMMKWADKAMKLVDVKLLLKSGGKSGTYQRSR